MEYETTEKVRKFIATLNNVEIFELERLLQEEIEKRLDTTAATGTKTCGLCGKRLYPGRNKGLTHKRGHLICKECSEC